MRAMGGAQTSEERPQGVCGLGVIGCEILDDIHRRVPHVPHTYRCCRRPRVDKIAQITEMRSQACVAGIVDEDEQLQSSPLVARRDPVGHLKPIFSLTYLHILRMKGRHGVLAIAKWLNHGHHVYWNSARR